MRKRSGSGEEEEATGNAENGENAEENNNSRFDSIFDSAAAGLRSNGDRWMSSQRFRTHTRAAALERSSERGPATAHINLQSKSKQCPAALPPNNGPDAERASLSLAAFVMRS